MASHHAVHDSVGRLIELRGAQCHATVPPDGNLRIRSQGDAHDAGVEEPEQLLGAQGRWTGLEPVDPAPHVGLEVDVGLEGEATELDDRTELVPQDPQHLLGGLDRAPPLRQRLVQVRLDHLVDL